MTVTDPTTQSETLFVLESDGPVVDDGLFGPGSMAWKVWSHPAAFVGAVRSFMAEMLSSPEGAAAIATEFVGFEPDSTARWESEWSLPSPQALGLATVTHAAATCATLP